MEVKPYQNYVGLQRPVDKLGRVSIPAEYRKQYGIVEGKPVEVIGVEGGILIRPVAQ